MKETPQQRRVRREAEHAIRQYLRLCHDAYRRAGKTGFGKRISRALAKLTKDGSS